MWGLSYGGINALNVGSRRPPHLKACLSLYGSADIYQDFVYPGGIFNALPHMMRETFMLAMDLAPITYQDPAGDWRVLWNEHIRRVEKGDIWGLTCNRTESMTNTGSDGSSTAPRSRHRRSSLAVGTMSFPTARGGPLGRSTGQSGS